MKRRARFWSCQVRNAHWSSSTGRPSIPAEANQITKHTDWLQRLPPSLLNKVISSEVHEEVSGHIISSKLSLIRYNPGQHFRAGMSVITTNVRAMKCRNPLLLLSCCGLAAVNKRRGERTCQGSSNNYTQTSWENKCSSILTMQFVKEPTWCDLM